MRIFMWFIKNSLAMTYAMQSEKTIAFLPYIVVNKEETLKDIVIPRLDELKHFYKNAEAQASRCQENKCPLAPIHQSQACSVHGGWSVAS